MHPENPFDSVGPVNALGPHTLQQSTTAVTHGPIFNARVLPVELLELTLPSNTPDMPVLRIGLNALLGAPGPQLCKY